MTIEQGEIWLVNLDPTIGAEIKKSRPCIVVNHNEIGILPLKTIVPITDWKERYEAFPWMHPLQPNAQNGLKKSSAVDAFQIRNFSEDRFIKKLGRIDADTLREIHQKIIATLDLGLL